MSRKLNTYYPPRVAIIGAFPPPIGGNSVHIARLFSLLEAQGYEVQVLDYIGKPLPSDPASVTRLSGSVWFKSWQVLKFMWRIPRDTIVHFHVSALARFRWFAPVLLVASLGHKRVITIHSGSFVEGVRTPWQKLYIRLILLQFDALIAVSEEIRDSLLSLGIQFGRIYVIPAYIKQEAHPQFLPATFEAIPQDKVKIVTSGYLTPLYHYESLVSSIRHLDQDKFHFVFAFYNEYDEKYERELMDQLREYSNITIYRDLSPQEFLAVLASSHTYVRTASRDGDSVAVREALALGKNVYASDCVRRPSGCVVFRDAQELSEYLQAQPVDRQMQESGASEENQKILDLYDALSKDREYATSSQ
ncbi:MAG: glycosyltransferase family 4 protein [Anaerolineales bacterium]|nr:glycosyltransferase family 4 protein [Anaerolineales bacterium]